MSSNKHALLIGINEYEHPEIAPLRGCVNDVRLVAKLLEESFGFPGDHITRLENQAATRDGILAAVDALVGRVGPDDIVVIHYSGHGSQMTDREGDEPDGMDETIVPYDSGRGAHENRDITDDEIYLRLKRLAELTPFTTLIFDSCHSGTISRDPFGAPSRQVAPDNRPESELAPSPIPPELAEELRAKTRDVSPSGWLPLGQRYVLVAGCRDEESSYEHRLVGGDGAVFYHGALTYFLCRALAGVSTGTTYLDVFEETSREVSNAFQRQHPQMEGARDREVFGVRDIQPLRYVPAEPSEGGGVTLHAGAAHGLTAGSRWALYAPGTHAGGAEPPLAVVNVTRVGALTSRGEVETGSAEAVSAGARAVEVGHAFGEMRLNVKIQAPADYAEAGKQLANAIKSSPMLRQEDDAGMADVCAYVLPPRDSATPGEYPVPQLGAVREATWAVVGQDGRLVLPLHGVREANVLTVLRENLEKLLRYRQVLALRNPNPNALLAGSVEMVVERRDSAGTWVVATAHGGGPLVLEEGDMIRVRVTNHYKDPIYVTLLNMDLTGAIEAVYPPSGRHERLQPGVPLIIGGTEGAPLFIPESYPFVVDPADAGAAGGIETFKLIATTSPADFGILGQAEYRAAHIDDASSPLEQLMRLAATGEGTRNWRPNRVPKEAEWITVELSFLLRRAAVSLGNGGGAAVLPAEPLGHGGEGTTAEVRVEPHPELRAKARIVNAGASSRSLGGRALPEVLRRDPSLTPALQFSSARDVDDAGVSVLELLDVNDHRVVTPERPLEISLPVSLGEGEHLLALGFDGEFYLPLGATRGASLSGTATRSAGGGTRDGARVVLQRLPAPTSDGQRDAVGSVKIFFHKVISRVVGADFPYPLLAVAEVDETGNVAYEKNPEKVRARVTQAERVVLYVHGILGDTVGMAASALACGVSDLVLTFDYENINTPIEDTARALKQRLEAAGLGADHGKTLQIIAHSMGGLVSRWFIEREGGNRVVQHLILLGTPSSGSPWPSVQAWATTALGLGLNGLCALAWPAQLLGAVLAGIEKVDETLDQMAPDSLFLRSLAASADPGVPYTVIAGNTSLVAAAATRPTGGGASALERLINRLLPDNLLHQATAPAFFGQPNDIAVSVESIHSVPRERHPPSTFITVPCDHVTYFSQRDSIESLSLHIGRGWEESREPER